MIMSRIGKCKERGCDGEITIGSYANWEKGLDATGFCRKCFREYGLEYKGPSRYLTLIPVEADDDEN